MKHHSNIRTLGRERSQRKALLRGLARDLVLRGAITTTVSKAKEVRPFVERLITASKANTLASRRRVASQMANADDVVKKLHEEIAPKYAERAGGYTRIIKLGRTGTRTSEEARIELV